MLGLVGYREDGARLPRMRVIRGVRFCAVYIVRGAGMRARLSLSSAARTLARENIRRAVFEVDDTARSYLEARGVAGFSGVPLYRATAAAIARQYLAQAGVDPAHATVAFAAERVTPELSRAAMALACDVRYVTLAVPSGGEELARLLRRELGVAARLAVPGEAVRAELTLCFDPCAAADAALPLYDPALAVTYGDALPPALLAALWSSGALDAEKLAVRAVEAQNNK